MVDLTVIAIPVFMVTMVAEALVLRARGGGYDAVDTATSISGGIGNVIVKTAAQVLLVPVYGFFYGHRFFTLEWGWATAIALFLADDLTYYVYHRTSHEVRFFWASHVVHHSSDRYTLATALRQPWTSPLLAAPFWFPLALIGFRPEWIAVMASLSLLYQYWIHTETIRTLGPLEWVLNTPSHHRVHHGSNPRYIDRNHAGILIIWDRLFGTFEPETEPVRYGLTTQLTTHNPLRVQFHELADIGREIAAARSLRELWKALTYMPPRPTVP